MSDIFYIINQLILNIYHSNFFSVLKFLIGIYTSVLIVDIILLLMQRNLGGDIRNTFIGMDVPPEIATRKKQLIKKWDRIRLKVQDKNESVRKVAIIEGDNIIDDLIKRMGYPGENMGERLEGILPGQIENIEELKKAHKIRNKIIHDQNFTISIKEAQKIIGYYEKFLEYCEVLH